VVVGVVVVVGVAGFGGLVVCCVVGVFCGGFVGVFGGFGVGGFVGGLVVVFFFVVFGLGVAPRGGGADRGGQGGGAEGRWS
jgi:hypothetical protein